MTRAIPSQTAQVATLRGRGTQLPGPICFRQAESQFRLSRISCFSSVSPFER